MHAGMERLRTEHLARAAGLPESRPTLDAVDRRRSQLWVLSLLAVLALPIGIASIEAGSLLSPTAAPADVLRLRLLLAAMLVAVLGLVVVRERTLRQLAARLVAERELVATLAERVDGWAELLDASRAVNATLELPVVLQRILDAASSISGAGGGSIQLTAPSEPGWLEVVAVSGVSEAPIGHRQRIGEGLAGAVAATREGRLLNGPQPEGHRQVDSSLVVPLLHRGDLVGVLNLAIGPDSEPFAHPALHAVGILGEAAATAIVNARALEAARASIPLAPDAAA
jgi:GAF domain-containing protein